MTDHTSLTVAPHGRTFDRVPEFDERSRLYPVRALVGRPSLAARTRHKQVWTPPYILDQGSDGACVGFGWTAELGAAPRKWGVSNEGAFALYHEAQKHDPWAGTEHVGSTVLAGAKAALALDRISSYHWCFNIDDVIDAICFKGPVVVGTNWYNSMFEPTPEDSLRVEESSGLAGGHCWLVYGYIPQGHKINKFGKDMFLMQNSWGADWAMDGRAYIAAEDLARLLAQDGEACVATDVRPRKA